MSHYMPGYIPLWFRFVYSGFVPWCFWFTCPVWVNLTVWLQHTLYSRVSLFEPRFSAGPYHHTYCVVPFICTVAFSEPLWTVTNVHALPVNDIFVNVIVYRSFMFVTCQGNAWKPYKLKSFLVGFYILFFHQFYNLVWSKSNVLTRRPLKYLSNGEPWMTVSLS